MDPSNIHINLRNIRKIKHMTLKEISQKTGLSLGNLSNIERGLRSPTMENLQNICTAMGISFTDLLEKSMEPRVLIRADERTRLVKENGYSFEIIDFGQPNYAFGVQVLDPGDNDSLEWIHEFDEIGFVVSGSMITYIDGKSYAASKGDCIFIERGKRHNCINESQSSPCVSFWTRCYDDPEQKSNYFSKLYKKLSPGESDSPSENAKR